MQNEKDLKEIDEYLRKKVGGKLPVEQVFIEKKGNTNNFLD